MSPRMFVFGKPGHTFELLETSYTFDVTLVLETIKNANFWIQVLRRLSNISFYWSKNILPIKSNREHAGSGEVQRALNYSFFIKLLPNRDSVFSPGTRTKTRKWCKIIRDTQN